MNKKSCPKIPLKKFRKNELRNLLDNILTNDGISLDQIYLNVLNHFGDNICQPEQLCPHGSRTQPEYQHVVRLALWDGQRDGIYYKISYAFWGRK